MTATGQQANSRWERHAEDLDAYRREEAAAPTAPLTPEEEAELAKCVAAVDRGMQTFIEVGQALGRIRDGRLYRETHATFEDFCRQRWGMDRVNAHRHIEAAHVTELLSTDNVPSPSSVRVTRELARLRDRPETMRRAWRETVRFTQLTGAKPTAEQVRAVVQQYRPSKPPPQPEEQSQQRTELKGRELTRANAARRVFNNLFIGTLEGTRAGLSTSDDRLRRALLVASTDEKRAWIKTLERTAAELRRIRALIEEAPEVDPGSDAPPSP